MSRKAIFLTTFAGCCLYVGAKTALGFGFNPDQIGWFANGSISALLAHWWAERSLA